MENIRERICNYEFETPWSTESEWLDECIETESKNGTIFEIDNEETKRSTSTSRTNCLNTSSKSIDSFKISCIEETESIISFSELDCTSVLDSYPSPVDPGIIPAFWILYPDPPVYQQNGVEKFFDIANLLKLIPIKNMRKQLQSDHVNLSYYRLNPEIIQVLSEAMLLNVTVKSLNLTDNPLTPSACYHINRLLLQNTVLTSLNLSNCKIGAEGAKKLKNGISGLSVLTELNLSGCKLGSEGFYFIASSVPTNTLLQNLDLSNNNLDEDSALYLHKMLSLSESLEYLNLSRNKLSTKETSDKLFQGLIKNISIIHIDLSWNSIGQFSIVHLCNFIVNTKIMQHLNLAANCFSDNEALKLAQALIFNRSLKKFDLNKNPITSKGITEFINVLNVDQFLQSHLELINFENSWALKEALIILNQLKETNPNLVVKLKGILGKYDIYGPDLKQLYFMSANHEALSTKKKRDRKFFGHFVLSIEGSIMRKDKFLNMIDDAKIKISENLAKEIANQFLVTKRTISIEALKESYMFYFPDTKLPKPPTPPVVKIKNDLKQKPSKKKKIKKEKKKKSRK